MVVIYLQVIGAQTQGLNGQQPANMAGLKKGGCTAVSNASAPFANDDVVLRTLEYAAGLDSDGGVLCRRTTNCQRRLCA